jgi:glycosyltransferase involved in cell wall biosynthesis
MNNIKLAVVVPCFNEEAVLSTTIVRLDVLMSQLVAEGLIAPGESTVTFIDDGSIDNTWRLIEETALVNPLFHGIRLSRNCGHQYALLAGLSIVEGDAIVSVDADLQDDLSAIRDMVQLHRDGAQIVFGIRSKRNSDTWFKRWSAEGYYKLLAWFGVDIVYNHADYRLMGRSALDALKQYGEVNVFLRGLVPTLGFRTANVYYERVERFAGESKYPLRKMLKLAWDGVTSFSAVPLRWITIFGFVVSLISFAVGGWALWIRVFTPDAVPGWASTVIPMYFLGGVQLLSLGIIGEYISKIYAETKARPRFIVEKRVGKTFTGM